LIVFSVAGGFASDLMKKDIGLAIDAAAQAKVPLPLGAKTLDLYQELHKSGFGGKDFSSIYEFLNSGKLKL
jgi:3-hydroxyisobutyrate dehydrogenase